MKILLFAMPNTADVIDNVGRLPNLAIVSLAGNLPNHDVRVMDLVIHKPAIRKPIEEVIRTYRPALNGLRSMTFQFDTLLRIARFIRSMDPSIKLAGGGYHPTLMAQELTAPGTEPLPLDFLIRGEGEQTFAELADRLDTSPGDLGDLLGLSFRRGDTWVHNPPRPLADVGTIRLPRRDARLSHGFRFLTLPMDVIETSRGCPSNCKFCSITHMYGRSFRPFPMERVVADLKDIRSRGTRSVFLTDDNITHDIPHFRRVCQAIIDNGLNDMLYAVQVSAAGIANNPDLVKDMARANFRLAFVGFESMLPSALKNMNKPTTPDINRRAAKLLKENQIGILAGIIAGYPDDTAETIRQSFDHFLALNPDMIWAQYLTPYPKTVLRDEMLKDGLVANVDDFTKYDGFTCNTRTRHLSQSELYGCLKRQALRAYLTPSLIFQNYFIRNYLWSFLGGQIINLAATIGYILRGNQGRASLDL